MEFAYYNPTRLMFGEETFGALGEVTAPLGTHALLVTGRSAMEKAGYTQAATELMEQAGLKVSVYNKIPSNPPLSVIKYGGELVRTIGCDLIVGLGGGSAMDAAKAIAVAATHEGCPSQFLLPDSAGRKKKPGPDTLPVVCVTSTAGTSSELTPFAVITVDDTYEKTSLASDYTYPRVAICDPELTYSLPQAVTASTGVDIFCHAAEGFISTIATPLTDLHALRAMELVAANLPTVIADGQDAGARRNMSLANVFAGFTLSQMGTNLMHGLDHPMSGRFPHVAHGAGLAAVIVGWARFMWQRDPRKFAQIARIFGSVADDDMEAAAETPDVLAAFLKQVGMDVKLRDLEIPEEAIQILADDSVRYMMGGISKTPGGVTHSDILNMLREAW